MDPKQVVADGYDRLHALYADWTAGRPDRLRHQYIDKVYDLGQAAPRTALDLGCGTGRHATAYLVARGLQVTGVDISGASVEVATREVTGARFIIGDMVSALSLVKSISGESGGLVSATLLDFRGQFGGTGGE